MKKRIFIIGICILLLLLVAFFVVRSNSLTIALKRADLQTSDVTHVVKLAAEENAPACCILQTRTANGRIALVRAVKGKLGFWSLEDIDISQSNRPYATTGCIHPAGLHRSETLSVPYSVWEFHTVYAGDNALRKIELPPELIPENTTVNIQQNGSFYLIHAVSTTEKADDVPFNGMWEILTENGFIPDPLS